MDRQKSVCCVCFICEFVCISLLYMPHSVIAAVYVNNNNNNTTFIKAP